MKTRVGRSATPAVSAAVTPATWSAWRASTPARIALGRAGAAMPTDETLRFGLAHARARDAVHAALDTDALAAALAAAGWPTARARSCAGDRATYLRRPDLGRQLDPAAVPALDAIAATDRAARGGAVPDLCFVVGDGLSALAAARHAVPLLAELRPRLPPSLSCTPVVIATQARVALADDIGERFGARIAAILIGERPGLSSPDSLGVYLTWAPRRGRVDAERNCISNVRPAGLGYAAAAHKLSWLLLEALRRGETGVALKDDSDAAAQSRARRTGTITR
ncbi:MAG: ethanolamine ammonia-lyase subunit EutC [Lautropia sp.]